MFNKISSVLKIANLIMLVALLFISCKTELQVDFSEETIETSDSAIIALNFPKAEGSEEITNRINKTLEDFIITQINISENDEPDGDVYDAIARFNYEFNRFKNDFPESSKPWEAFIDGEVTYRSPEVITIAMTSYLDTGGAHGNSNVRFFNFNAQNGNVLPKEALINDMTRISKIIKTHLLREIEDSSSEDSVNDLFFGNDFQLPENLGYSDEGLIVLYNPYEIASYSQGIIEFTIPFEEVSSFLKVY